MEAGGYSPDEGRTMRLLAKADTRNVSCICGPLNMMCRDLLPSKVHHISSHCPPTISTGTSPTSLGESWKSCDLMHASLADLTCVQPNAITVDVISVATGSVSICFSSLKFY